MIVAAVLELSINLGSLLSIKPMYSWNLSFHVLNVPHSPISVGGSILYWCINLQISLLAQAPSSCILYMCCINGYELWYCSCIEENQKGERDVWLDQHTPTAGHVRHPPASHRRSTARRGVPWYSPPSIANAACKVSPRTFRTPPTKRNAQAASISG